MKSLFFFGIFGWAVLLPAGARTWTDVKGRKIEAEFVSQTADSVVLKLKNGSEVSVPIKTLSRADLGYLIEMDTDAPAEEGEKTEKKEEGGGETGALPMGAPDPAWERPVPREAVLKEPLEIQEEKKGELMHYASSNFRIVADGRVSSKAVEAILESCELALIYCESLPFGLSNRFAPVDGKYEIHSTGKQDDWQKAGGQQGSRATFNPVTGELRICLELFGLSSGGRGGSDSTSLLASQMILHIGRCMIPEVYDRSFMDWFKEGFPNLLNMGLYEKGRLDYSEAIKETKELLLGKSRSGQPAIFKREVGMPKMSELITQTVGGIADADGQRQMLGQSVVVMAYLVFLEDGGKATGLREGLRYAHDFQKNFPKTIRAATQEEADRIKAELIKQRDEMGDTATAMIFGKRPWPEVEADLTKLWEEQGLKVVFDAGDKK